MDLQAATTETDLKRLSDSTFLAPASSPPAFRKGFAMTEESLLRWCWPMVPLRHGSTGIGIQASGDVMFDRRPSECENIQLPADQLPRPGNTVRLLYREVWNRFEFRTYYVATDAELRTCQDLFPDSADPGDPPWLQVEAELVTAGNSSSELRTDSALTLLNRLKASRKQPEPESTPNTFGRLLADLRNHDATRKLANRTGAKATGSLEVGSASAYYVIEGAKFHADADKIWAAIMARPEVGRVQAICEAETGRFDSETLKIIRGRLCVSLNVEPSSVDAMGVEQFADAWHSNTSAEITTAVESIAAEQGAKPQSKVVTPKPNKMKAPMAEMYARRLKESDPKFVFGTHLEWGKAIAAEAGRDTGQIWTCSGSTAQSTELWDEEMERQGRSRKCRSVKASGSSAKRGATIGESDDALISLYAEQEQPAVDAILESGMSDKEKAETIRKVREGLLSVPNAIDIAKRHQKRKSPVPNRH